jgi:16S rRNA (guanine1207-N2)-methyltransferase
MEHYFCEKPGGSKDELQIKFRLNSDILCFCTANSVFSKSRVDNGTNLLIKECRLKDGLKILDLGCGYGVIGISLARLFPLSKITMSDINERALDLTRKNISLNEVNAQVVKSSFFENINEKFDAILSNPPFSAGKEICYMLVEQSYAHLEKNGSLQMVAPGKKGGKELSNKMRCVFGNVETIGRQSGYQLYYSVKS